MQTITQVIEITVIECCTCGISFGMPESFRAKRRKDHEGFYCPSGHWQHYTGDNTEERLRKQLEDEQSKLANVQFEMMAAEKKIKRLEKRAKNGVCPCCHRQFVSMARHMKSQHPEFGE